VRITISEVPFWHAIVDDFFEEPGEIAREFPHPDDNCWFRYNNPLEIKQTCNDWSKFGPATYRAFTSLCQADFTQFLSHKVQEELVPDYGLHGGGLHQHGRGGKLNVHLDYNIHPKVNLQRRLNIIVYVTPNWDEDWGGHLGLYDNKKRLVKAISPEFNRGVIFDTRGSWHGLPEPITCPEDVTRNSLAMYYLCEPGITDGRKRALFSPTEDQAGDPEIDRLIAERSKM
jgi:hypothetical protein